ncbi:hypothetical protein PPSIR1_13355 [Plesiocystis pacifica SIR-1]|uniref:EGF-like domain-containing protein n=1 Tax=Plesiocystis pacifica SIR-1 TaxID=391625 RepID=A6GEQ1_9BACT|nr:hypothetical protein PPSIR1_13355 [Plesiocystis pacifica SIR-1]
MIMGLGALAACSEEEGSDELARAVIGPEGGELAGGGVSVTLPPKAVLVDTEFVLRSSDRQLSEAGWEQVGKAVVVEPSQRLLLPASVRSTGAEALLIAGGAEEGLTVVHEGDWAYLEYLGTIASAAPDADSPAPSLALLEPELDASPEQPGVHFVDNLHVELALEGTDRVDLVLSAWDYSGENLALNGAGHCAFEIGHLEGGSLTTGCASGQLTASIHATGDWISFDILPLQLPALDAQISVGVVAGDGELSYALGYFAFETAGCYQEVCDDHGICVNGSEPSCECDEGYAPPPDDPLGCACVPQCGGKECGSDTCGGSCGSCADGMACDDGTCVPEGGGTDDGGTDTTDTTDTTDDGGTDTTDGGTDTTDGGTDTTDGGMDTTDGGMDTTDGDTTG